jgi:hypothetical protein
VLVESCSARSARSCARAGAKGKPRAFLDSDGLKKGNQNLVERRDGLSTSMRSRSRRNPAFSTPRVTAYRVRPRSHIVTYSGP